MNNIIVTHKDGTTFPLLSRKNVSSVTKAEQHQSLLSEDIVSLSVTSAVSLPFMLGDTISVFGKTYTLNNLPQIKKQSERNFEYEVTFEGVQYELLDAQFLLPDNTVGDSLTGNLEKFLNLIIENANRVFGNGKWNLGEFPKETEFKTETFTAENCLQVLQRICQEYEQEFEIVQNGTYRTLHIHKAGQNFPFTFTYGRTGGLYDITRQNVSSKNIVTRLFAYGGAQNVLNEYLKMRHSSRLCLPTKNKNNSFIENTEAIQIYGIKENTHNFDDIFPNRYGTVTQVDSLNSFRDSEMFNLKERWQNNTTDYQYWLATRGLEDTPANFDIFKNDVVGGTKWLIKDVSAKINFTTGNLAGYMFELHDFIEIGNVFVINSFKDENLMEFPSQTSVAFQIAVGDKYFISDINLPQQYVDEAENNLLQKATEYYDQNAQPLVEYALTIDERFLKQFTGELTVVNLFAVGDYIPIKDTDIGVDKSVRITSFIRDLTQKYSYQITLGDAIAFDTQTRLIADNVETGKIIDINNLADPARARMNWRTAQEVLGMTFDPDGNFFSDKISPLAIETLAILAGSRSQQLSINFQIIANYENNPNVLRVTSGVLTHFTIAEPTTKIWNIAANTTTLTENIPYYIYARCNQSSTAGMIIFSNEKITVAQENGWYHFLLGVVSSIEAELNQRIVNLSYGMSFINGRFIKTGRIESSGGGTAYFDLDNAEIGGRINFKDGLISGDIALTDNDSGNVTAGLNGSSLTNVGAWFGGTFQEAKDGTANIILYKNGNGKIGIFKVYDDYVEVINDENHVIITPKKLDDVITEPKNFPYSVPAIEEFSSLDHYYSKSITVAYNHSIAASSITIKKMSLWIYFWSKVFAAPDLTYGNFYRFFAANASFNFVLKINGDVKLTQTLTGNNTIIGDGYLAEYDPTPYTYTGAVYLTMANDIVINEPLLNGDIVEFTISARINRAADGHGTTTTVEILSGYTNEFANILNIFAAANNVVLARDGFGVTNLNGNEFIVKTDSTQGLVVKGNFPQNTNNGAGLEQGRIYRDGANILKVVP